MPRTVSGRARPSAAEVDRLNDEFHNLLREAAEKREARALAQSIEESAAARQESADLLALARRRRSDRRPASH